MFFGPDDETVYAAVEFDGERIKNPGYSNKYVDMKALEMLIQNCAKELEGSVESLMHEIILNKM